MKPAGNDHSRTMDQPHTAFGLGKCSSYFTSLIHIRNPGSYIRNPGSF